MVSMCHPCAGAMQLMSSADKSSNNRVIAPKPSPKPAMPSGERQRDHEEDEEMERERKMKEDEEREMKENEEKKMAISQISDLGRYLTNSQIAK